MRPLLIVLVCFATFTQSPKPHTENKQNTQPQVSKSSDNQSISNPIKPPETQFYTYNNQNSDGNETAKKISDYSLSAFTLALVVVSVMQWRVLRKHEEWMQKHDANLVKLADAALLNAQALIQTERPWLMLGVVTTGPNIDEVEFYETDSLDTKRRRHATCTFHLHNYGRTPAIVTAQKWELQMGKKAETPVDLPFFSLYLPVSPYIFPQGVSQPKIAVLAQEITADMKAAFDLGFNFIYICGFIKYRDAVPREPLTEYETKFCYSYSEVGGEPIWHLGPARYNSAS